MCRGELCCKRCNLVLLRLVLYLAQLRKDGVGIRRGAVAEGECVRVRRVHQRVGLVAYGQLVLITHRGDGVLRFAATVGNLCDDVVVTALDGIDNLRTRQADAVLNVAKRALDLLSGAVQGLRQLTDGRLVAVQEAGDQFRRSVRRVAPSAKETIAVVVPSENRSHDSEVNHAPDAILSSETAIVSYDGKQIRVERATAAHDAGKHGRNVELASARAVPVLIKNIRSFHLFIRFCRYGQ